MKQEYTIGIKTVNDRIGAYIYDTHLDILKVTDKRGDHLKNTTTKTNVEIFVNDEPVRDKLYIFKAEFFAAFYARKQPRFLRVTKCSQTGNAKYIIEEIDKVRTNFQWSSLKWINSSFKSAISEDGDVLL
ncbi:Phage protein [Caenorhabditis elegans]|uniref:Phage protein n=1 Tax=Caenorhabditis elegans TaxID=6239 RepID=Q9XVZ0_CAEEL|nr:Phage protein [Caenorhabditis elegans]CAA22464.3 Phage protein [Caenorhabditis elegans]